MSTTDPEAGKQPTVAEIVTDKMRTTVDRLQALTEAMVDESVSPSAESLMVGSIVELFVAAKQDEKDILTAPRPEIVDRVAQSWLEVLVRDKIARSAYRITAGKTQLELNTLLDGRMIRASSLDGLAFPTADGYTQTGDPDGPTEVEAPYLGVDPTTGSLFLGTVEHSFHVSMFNPDDTATPRAEIEVL